MVFTVSYTSINQMGKNYDNRTQEFEGKHAYIVRRKMESV